MKLRSGAALAQPAAQSNSNSAPGFNLPIPNIPGKSITALVVNYPPGGGTPAHRHAPSAFITGYVLEGAVRSQVDGRLQEVFFKEGQAVRRGDLLAQVDPRPFQAQLQQAEAQLVDMRKHARPAPGGRDDCDRVIDMQAFRLDRLHRGPSLRDTARKSSTQKKSGRGIGFRGR